MLEQVTASRAPSRSSGKHTHTHTHPTLPLLGETHTHHSLISPLCREPSGESGEGWNPEVALLGNLPRGAAGCVQTPLRWGCVERSPRQQAARLVAPADPRTRPGTHPPHRLLPEGWPFVPGCSQVLRHPEPSGRAFQPCGEFWWAPGKFPARGCSPPGGPHRRLSEPRGRVGSGLRSGLGPGTRTHTPGAEQLPKVSPLLRAAGVPPAPSAPAPLPAGRAALNCSQFAEGGVLSWTLRETKQPKTAPS